MYSSRVGRTPQNPLAHAKGYNPVTSVRGFRDLRSALLVKCVTHDERYFFRCGVRHIYVDGGITIQSFLRAGLVQRLIITRVPVLIGEGIPLFGILGRDVQLKHVATQQYASGLVKSEYRVAS